MLLFELEHCSSRDRIWKLPCLQCDHQQAIAMRKWHRFVFRGKTVKREDRDGIMAADLLTGTRSATVVKAPSQQLNPTREPR